MRLRKVDQYGNTWVIKLKPYDVKDMQWKKGTKVDIDVITEKEDKDGEAKK